MLNIKKYCEEDRDRWERFINDSGFDIFIMRRNFLDYHQDRFIDESLLIELDGNVISIVAACKSNNQVNTVVCHEGLSFGGPLFSQCIEPEVVQECIELIKSHYMTRGFEKIIIKLVPGIYLNYSQEFVHYALLASGFRRDAIEVSSTIALDDERKYSSMRARRIKRAMKFNIEVIKDFSFCEEFWVVLQRNLAERYGNSPVHSIDQILDLKSKFDSKIQLYVALDENRECIAGNLFFDSELVRHSQYTASSRKGREVSGNDLVIHTALLESKQDGKVFFDFGISTEMKGKIINSNLLKYKQSFGGNITLNHSWSCCL